MNVEIIEQNLEKLDSVVSSKLVIGENNSIDEIHVVSNGSRNVKQIVRDIQSVLIATYNIQIDHKKISIAEIMDDNLRKKECRLKIVSVSRNNSGQRATIEVVLNSPRGEFRNSASGIYAGRNIDRMIVDATLRTIEEACGYDEIFILEDIKAVNISTDKAVLIVIMCVENGKEQRLCGSCMIKSDYNEAVVKATLDAINRYVTK